MQRNTPTNIARLRKGDRFYFISDKKKGIHEVTGFSKGKVNYNKINGFKHQWFWDRTINENKEVIFLRHTIIQQGDQCFVQDLEIGDVFYMPGNIDAELEVLEKNDMEIKLKSLGTKNVLYTHPLSTGIFIRNSKN